jgi:hypothetical protein
MGHSERATAPTMRIISLSTRPVFALQRAISQISMGGHDVAGRWAANKA